MLSITAVSAGAIDYLLKGSGCACGDHGAEPAEGAEAQPPGAEYLISSASAEPAGVWFGTGLAMVGMVAGEQARENDVRAVFGHLRHPSSTEEEPVFLGRPPRTFAATEERIQRACAAEPDAGPERRAEIANQVRGDRRKAVGYYDLTFSPVKSVSVYWAALTSQGRHAEAQMVVQAHREGIAEAMSWAEGEVAWTRVGYHGRTASGRSVGRYEAARGLVWTRWDHSTNRACEPQLHSHVAVLNRVVTACDGQIRAVDGRGFRAVKYGVDAIYAQAYEQRLTEWLGVRFEWRPDGRAREILGVDQQLLAEASSRRQDVVEGVENLVAEYRQRHGYEPSPATRTRLARVAAMATRAAKSSLAPAEQIRQWCAPRLARLGWSLREAEHRATLRDQRNQSVRTVEAMLAAAVEAVQAQHATWDVGLLQKAIADELTRAPCAVSETLPELTTRVLAEPTRFGLVLVSAPDPVPVPSQLRRADGKSRYRPHHDERYTTLAQLDTETGIVAAARTPGAPALDPVVLLRVGREVDSAGLSHDQAAAVLGILSSGRSADVLIGPAGTGKSHTVGVLAETWRRHCGGRVIGLATSQIATMELADNGLEAMNATRFLTTFTADPPVGDRIARGDLVVLDEVGMTSTAQLAEISRLVAGAGGKLLYTGDHEQLAAIGAGGMLHLLVSDNGCFELTEIHRFTYAWERSASAALRTGDTGALEVYERDGRLVGGSIEDLTDTVVRAYLADTIAGHQSLLVVGSNSQATELSGRIHDELVRLGHIREQALATTRDGNSISVGDLIQARRNDASIPVEGGGMVTNRVTYRVLGHDRCTGELQVADPHGCRAHLPAGYVAEHVTLAYASTVHAAQGRTVDTCHALIEPGADRRSVYVAMTRGRDSNTAYVVCERDADGHLPERLDSTARAQLANALASVDYDTTQAAETVRRAGVHEGRSLAWIATQWDLVTTDICTDRCTRTLTTLLDPATTRTVLGEPGYPRLMRAVRAAQLAGHDVDAVLSAAVAERSLFGADSISDVLRWRISITTASRTPDRDTAVSGWVAMTPSGGGAVGEYAVALAQRAQARQHEFGSHAASQQPEWALRHLGPPPADRADHAEWVRRAGVIAAYRDLTATPDEIVTLGPAPTREQVLHRALWQRAHTAAGAPADELDYTTASDTQLRDIRAAYQGELVWAPHWVHQELRDARLAATGYRRDAQLWAAEAQLLPAGSPERARADTDVHNAEQLAATYTARAEMLATIDTARRHWHANTEPLRTRYEHAGDELARRGLPRDLAPPPVEQLRLLDTEHRPPDADSRHDRLTETTDATHRDHPRHDPRHDSQAPLLAPTVNARDIAAAQPLRVTGNDTGDDAAADSRGTTLAEACRQARISTLRAQRRHWTVAAEQLLSERDSLDAHEDYGNDADRDLNRDRGRNQDEDLDQGADW
jgi:conjugative relaxase-like TrwC/TraI family protein